VAYIYKITNLVTNKIYIGRTTAKNAQRRWSEHKSKSKKPRTLIEKALNKYGIINFKFEIIDQTDRQHLPTLESDYIIKLNCLSPNGYNLEVYQPDRILTEDAKNRIQISNQGKIKSKNKSSEYIGVYKAGPSFICEIAFNRKKYKKTFNSELKAAIAYDKMALFLYGSQAKINFYFKKEKWINSKIEKILKHFVQTHKDKKNIYFDKERKKWCARIFIDRKTIYVGRFNSKEEAEEAKLKKLILLKNERN
jgi:group I intron endonuclease